MKPEKTIEEMSTSEKIAALRDLRLRLSRHRVAIEETEKAIEEARVGLFNDLRVRTRGLDDYIKGQVTGERVSPRAIIDLLIEAMCCGAVGPAESREDS